GNLAGFRKPYVSVKLRANKPRILAALKAHARTKTYAEIADLLGVPHSTVVRIGKQAGFWKPHVWVKYRADRPRILAALKAHGRTRTYTGIAALLGLPVE